jgi:hypothetical protein
MIIIIGNTMDRVIKFAMPKIVNDHPLSKLLICKYKVTLTCMKRGIPQTQGNHTHYNPFSAPLNIVKLVVTCTTAMIIIIKKLKKHCLSADGYKPKKASTGYVGRIQYWTLGRIIMGMIARPLGGSLVCHRKTEIQWIGS